MESVWKEWDIQFKLVEAVESKCDQVNHVAAHLFFPLTLFPTLSQQWWWSPSITPRTIRTHYQHNPVHVSPSSQHEEKEGNKAFLLSHLFLSPSVQFPRSEKFRRSENWSTFLPKEHSQFNWHDDLFSLYSSCAAVHASRPFVSLFTYFKIPWIRREESYVSESGKPVRNGQ